jgi:hypothetical protein
VIKYRSALAATLCFAATACGDDGESIVIVPEADAAVSPSGATSSVSSGDESTPPREGPWGCYLEDHHKCDCSIESEADCDGVGLWVEGCATCDETTEDTTKPLVDGGSPMDTSASDADTDVGFGCYDPSQHACTCGGTEDECEEDNVWTTECDCADAPDTASDAAMDASPESSEAGPNVDGGSSALESTTSTDTSSATSTSSLPDASGTADAGQGWACYDDNTHQCDCGISEEQCSAGDGIWTTECPCSLLDAGQ